MKEQEEKLIEFGIWKPFLLHISQVGMLHVHFPEYGYITNKDLLNITFYSLLTMVICFGVLYIINDLTNKE